MSLAVTLRVSKTPDGPAIVSVVVSLDSRLPKKPPTAVKLPLSDVRSAVKEAGLDTAANSAELYGLPGKLAFFPLIAQLPVEILNSTPPTVVDENVENVLSASIPSKSISVFELSAASNVARSVKNITAPSLTDVKSASTDAEYISTRIKRWDSVRVRAAISVNSDTTTPFSAYSSQI